MSFNFGDVKEKLVDIIFLGKMKIPENAPYSKIILSKKVGGL